MAVSNTKSRVNSSGMKAEWWNQVENLLNQALELPVAERPAFLDQHCTNSNGLRAEIESLLNCEKASETFLYSPAIAFSSGLLDDEPEEENQLIGQSVGNFTIVSELGRGGMGAVYLGERHQSGIVQRVAVKMLRRELNTAEFRRRFDRERQILASLEHPNITRLLDIGTTYDGVPFFIMEFVEGTPINIFCRTLPLEAALRLFGRVCETVAFAHHNLIVHRDLKPSNILITKDGTPKLLDFGISKLLESDAENPDEGGKNYVSTLTNFGALTPEYAAPEQLRGENITTASDIYSLGVILYELLTDQRPFNFERLNAPEMIQAVCTTEPEKPSAVITQINHSNGDSTARQKYQPVTQTVVRNPKLLRGDLDNIVLTALEKEPTRRYGTVEKFADDIERHLLKLPIRARPNTWAYRSHKFLRRHKFGVIVAVLIFLAISSSLAIALWQAKNARRERDAANLEQLRVQQINKFLQQMLSFSNQSVTSVSPVAETKNVTVNEMLDEIAPQIETEMANDSGVRAEILRTVGSSYGSQGAYQKAEKYLRESLEASSGSEMNAESAATSLELGQVLYRQYELDESAQVLEKAVAFYRAQQETDRANYNPANLALALDYLSVVKFYLRDPQTASALSDEAYQIVSATNFPASEHFAQLFVKGDHGAFLLSVGKPEQAEILLRQVVDEYHQQSDRPRWEIGVVLMFLGMNADNHKNPEEAEKYLTESEQILRQALGDKNGYLANNLDEQAIALNQSADYNQAEKKSREALEIYEELFPGKMPVAYPMTTLGIILTNAGHAPEGENYLRQALAIYEAQPKKLFTGIIRNKIGLSNCLRAQKRFSEADTIARKANEEARENLDEQDPFVKLAADNLSSSVLRNGNLRKH